MQNSSLPLSCLPIYISQHSQLPSELEFLLLLLLLFSLFFYLLFFFRSSFILIVALEPPNSSLCPFKFLSPLLEK
ncbi:hypothetical protein Csa_009843 [Cucumis sativus]|uniref:Uncharacterized protein n=1 Tax=Cucumis sativus TaxID=3659 RepID=A0A0A0L2U0_CUCSA|nr:hypothetical protein Csa_009843 [Cucumis sativus]